MQGLLQNPLADGSTLGVSAGASLGAACSIVLGLTLPGFPISGTVLLAMLFAFGSLAAILFLAFTLDRSLSTATIILIGVVYILVRCLGKYFGALVSSSMMHCSETVRKYLGVTLFPQAGVALGMVVSAQSLGAEYGSMIRNIILFSVLVYELFGPLLTKLALTRAGEIHSGATDAQNRARFQKKPALR